MTREHWIQVLAIVVPVIMTVVIMMASVSGRIAADEERISALEKVEASHYAGELAFQSEMRTSLGRVSDLLSDVRVAVGQRNHGK